MEIIYESKHFAILKGGDEVVETYYLVKNMERFLSAPSYEQAEQKIINVVSNTIFCLGGAFVVPPEHSEALAYIRHLARKNETLTEVVRVCESSELSDVHRLMDVIKIENYHEIFPGFFSFTALTRWRESYYVIQEITPIGEGYTVQHTFISDKAYKAILADKNVKF